MAKLSDVKGYREGGGKNSSKSRQVHVEGSSYQVAQQCLTEVISATHPNDCIVCKVDARPKCRPSKFPICAVHHLEELLLWGECHDPKLVLQLRRLTGQRRPSNLLSVITPKSDYYMSVGTTVHSVVQRALVHHRSWKSSLWTNADQPILLYQSDEDRAKHLKSSTQESKELFADPASGAETQRKQPKKHNAASEPASYIEPTVIYQVIFDFSEGVDGEPQLLEYDSELVKSRSKDKNLIVVSCTGHIDTVLQTGENRHLALDYKTTDPTALDKYRVLQDKGKLKSQADANQHSTFPYSNNVMQLSCYGSILLKHYGKGTEKALGKLDLALAYMDRGDISNFEIVPVGFGPVDQRRSLEVLHRNMRQVAVAEYVYARFIEFCAKLPTKSELVLKDLRRFFSITSDLANMTSGSAAVLYEHKLCKSASDHDRLYNPGKKPWFECPLVSICVGTTGRPRKELCTHLVQLTRLSG
jgi:hypothetical protein